jgi:hypothetical protein
MMWEEFVLKLMSLSMIRDTFNFVLRYLLGQPSEVDVVIAFWAFVEFTGISQWIFSQNLTDEQTEEELLISLPQLEPISKHQEF